jgi:YfiH family protein
VSLRYTVLEHHMLAHGTVVFKDKGFESPDSAWRGHVAGLVRKNLTPPPGKVVIPVQVHGNRVMRVDAGGGACEAPTCDGLVTASPGVVVGVNTADCIPLLAVSDGARVVGAVHCGWRGVASGIVRSFVAELRAALAEGAPAGGAGLEGAMFLLGPSVGACCYEVGPDFLDAFGVREAEVCATARGGRTRFDLRKLVAMRLAEEGIDRSAVFTDNTCTSCNGDWLCSYRAGGDTCGRMYTYVMIRDGGGQ